MSGWDDKRTFGDNLKRSVHKKWAESEMDKAKGKSGWLGLMGNEALDAGAFIMDGASISPDPYGERYRLIEKAKKQGPAADSQVVDLFQQGKLPRER